MVKRVTLSHISGLGHSCERGKCPREALYFGRYPNYSQTDYIGVRLCEKHTEELINDARKLEYPLVDERE